MSEDPRVTWKVVEAVVEALNGNPKPWMSGAVWEIQDRNDGERWLQCVRNDRAVVVFLGHTVYDGEPEECIIDIEELSSRISMCDHLLEDRR